MNEAVLLNSSSVEMMTQNQIGELLVETQPGAMPAISLDYPLGAGGDKFGLGFQLSATDKLGQRGVGSYSWSGIYNTHFWADPQNDIAAVILMQVLPFYDEECISALQGFENLIYSNLE